MPHSGIVYADWFGVSVSCFRNVFNSVDPDVEILWFAHDFNSCPMMGLQYIPSWTGRTNDLNPLYPVGDKSKVRRRFTVGADMPDCLHAGPRERAAIDCASQVDFILAFVAVHLFHRTSVLTNHLSRRRTVVG